MISVGGEGGVDDEMQATLNQGSYWWESGMKKGGEHLRVCAYVLRCGKDRYKVRGDLLFFSVIKCDVL